MSSSPLGCDFVTSPLFHFMSRNSFLKDWCSFKSDFVCSQIRLFLTWTSPKTFAETFSVYYWKNISSPSYGGSMESDTVYGDFMVKLIWRLSVYLMFNLSP